MPKEFQSLVYILYLLGGRNDRLNEFVMLIYIYNKCYAILYNARTTLHCVESYLYYIILVYKKIFSVGVKRGRKKKTIYIDIVENIKFIYMILDEFFLPVSQRVEMNYIFSDNVRILYLSCYVKSPKETVKLSKKSRNKRCSNRF